jgi:uncharacterized membrane protein YraQ (UPF0718 family)
MNTARSIFRPDKRLVIGLLLTLGVAFSFWTSSRYPDLNEKAVIGGDRDLQGIAFDVVLEVKESDPTWKRIVYSTVNWAETNKKGMAFGLIFAACLLTILGFLEGGPLSGLMGNTFRGFMIGVPLGLCVNCAAPVAYGLNKGGSKPETALGAMLSSPTMNVIVIGMMFSLLPWYLAALKLLASLLLIFVVVPLLVRLAPKDWLTGKADPPESCSIESVCEFTDSEPVPDQWVSAARWTAKTFLRNLLRIAKQTVPLMLLAGFLGSLLITLLPFELMRSIAEAGTRYSPIWIMLGLAVTGVFLPVPMAFDIVVVVILIGLGIPESFAAVLLLTLGSYSIYSYLIVAKAFSHKLASCLTFAVAIIAIIAGLTAPRLKALDIFLVNGVLTSHFKNSQPPERLVPDIPPAVPWPVLQAELAANRLQFKPFTGFTNHGESERIQIASYSFPPKTNAPGPLFQRHSGEDLGIDLPTIFSIRKFVIYPQFFARGLASGDVHGDNYPDLLVPGDPDIGGLYLFANVRGRRFLRQELDLGALNRIGVLNCALVDLNNDAWLDIVFTTLNDGNYAMLNSGGRFNSDNLHKISQKPGTTGLSMGFSDFDNNGSLDMFVGNYTVGHVAEMIPISHESSRNQILFNNLKGGFNPVPLPDLPGETLGVMIADLNQDRNDDLVAFNDWAVSDMFYLGTPDGKVRRVHAEDGFIAETCWSTMSMRAADIDNDLVPEIFISQISQPDGINGDKSIRISLQEFENGAKSERERKLIHQYRQNMRIFRSHSHLVWLHFVPEALQQDWIAYRVVRRAAMDLNPGYSNHTDYQTGRPAEHRQSIQPNKRPDYRKFTPAHRDDVLMFLDRIESKSSAITDTDMPGEIRQNRENKNLLLKRDSAGRFASQTNALGLAAAGWTWNANFADLDHDGFQDVYIATGFTLLADRQNNAFFKNQGGKSFELQTDEFGLGDHAATSAYNYLDLDRDGDVDVVTLPVSIANARVFRNQGPPGNSVTVQLRDELGNSFAIGAQIVIHHGSPTEPKRQLRHVQASGGFMSFDPLEAHFGLGEHMAIDRIEVRWPDRTTNLLQGPFPANRCYRIQRRSPLQEK